ncbi:probable calcium-binding protein CML45 [Vicia villosa]|uniref:probable calcium-binding protein CML45 n=1 Tax=Vicia villosa TaxID=3911 RepID=UPI00273CB33B|nr:probable calcium-binding protein CML45 [Vicia villosa]
MQTSNMVFRQIEYLIAEEKASQNDDIDINSSSSSSLFNLIYLFLYSTFIIVVQKFFSSFSSFLSFRGFFLLCKLCSGDSDVKGEKQISEGESSVSRESVEIKRDEVETVMAKMGIFCSEESEELEEKYGSKELSELFEENEPSFEEVKMAFDVFDENKDGFIDAMELKRVLCILGFKEGLEVENCQKMIKKFDENQDGRIDFIEFVKIMENRLC